MLTRPLALAGAALLALPATAAAHSLGSSAADTSVPGFLPLGIQHMLLGWDHLLFILGVVLLAGEPRRAAKLVSTFVAGHSATLILASLMDWRVSPRAVDVAIIASVLVVGMIGVRGRPSRWAPVYAIVGGFGLVHGFGLATRLLDLGLPDGGVLPRVLLFNVGLEIGQLVAICVVVGVLWLVTRAVEAQRRAVLERRAFGGLMVVGLVGAMVLSAPGQGSRDTGEPVLVAGLPAGQAPPCTKRSERTPGGTAGGHPPKRFYGPGEQVPTADFDHVLGDGFAIVRYSKAVGAEQRRRLQTMVEDRRTYLLARLDAEQTVPITVTTAKRRMTCSRFHAPSIATFTQQWFKELQAGTA
jgi:hydrogenase/urease accessory protein HupE